jgi:hypothetical protein
MSKEGHQFFKGEEPKILLPVLNLSRLRLFLMKASEYAVS